MTVTGLELPEAVKREISEPRTTQQSVVQGQITEARIESLCRICQDDLNTDGLIFPCACRQGMHEKCLTKWIAKRPHDARYYGDGDVRIDRLLAGPKCEVCLEDISVATKPPTCWHFVSRHVAIITYYLVYMLMNFVQRFLVGTLGVVMVMTMWSVIRTLIIDFWSLLCHTFWGGIGLPHLWWTVMKTALLSVTWIMASPCGRAVIYGNLWFLVAVQLPIVVQMLDRPALQPQSQPCQCRYYQSSMIGQKIGLRLRLTWWDFRYPHFHVLATVFLCLFVARQWPAKDAVALMAIEVTFTALALYHLVTRGPRHVSFQSYLDGNVRRPSSVHPVWFVALLVVMCEAYFGVSGIDTFCVDSVLRLLRIVWSALLLLLAAVANGSSFNSYFHLWLSEARVEPQIVDRCELV